MKISLNSIISSKARMLNASFGSRFLALFLSFFLGGVAAFAQETNETGMSGLIDAFAGKVVGWIASVFFFPIYTSSEGSTVPLVVAWLVVGAIYFTIRAQNNGSKKIIFSHEFLPNFFKII